MQALHHSHWHTSVRLSGPESITADTTLLRTGTECSVRLRVNKRTFQIEKARWEIYRGEGGPLRLKIEALTGVEAYLGSGPALRGALSGSGADKALPLITESVRGIIQAETFLFRERGHEDSRSYDNYWNAMYADSCRYYSNLHRISVQWEQHIGDQARYGTLYNKFKTVAVFEEEDRLQAAASMSDSFHEVGIGAGLDKHTGALATAHCRLLRGPDPVCFEAADFSHNLLGKKLAGMTKKELSGYLAGGQGCIHIIDTWHDLALVLGDLCLKMTV